MWDGSIQQYEEDQRQLAEEREKKFRNGPDDLFDEIDFDDDNQN